MQREDNKRGVPCKYKIAKINKTDLPQVLSSLQLHVQLKVRVPIGNRVFHSPSLLRQLRKIQKREHSSQRNQNDCL